ncbi:hypothetical protein NP233_g10508 [Leucocoprinus birnbaumii]|uniref:Uncharacterized protein n=1 Tax=Leucocoprinus birnbaumii TaxID=56174 RepID=A0AAD5VIC1_9AGAR|nr:hypothetical protein NP233_g10508 [Leucocoprinus birnbaumii]
MPSTSTPSASSTSTPKNQFDHLAFTQKATGVSTEFEDEVTRYLSVAPHPSLKDGSGFLEYSSNVCEWIEAGLVTDKDIVAAISGLPDLGDDAEDIVEPGWDHIQKD